jgi:hypothetical protein
VSNRRKIKLCGRSGQPLPECADCDSDTTVTVIEDGPVFIRLDHDPSCPSWGGITPSVTEAFALAEAATGRTVVYAKARPS